MTPNPSQTLWATLLLLCTLALYTPQPLHAQETAPSTPSIHHQPPTAWVAGDPSPTAHRLTIQVNNDWRASELIAFVRTKTAQPTPPTWTRVVFKRTETNTFTARIPSDIVLAPGVEYAIASTNTDGHPTFHVANLQHPLPIPVSGLTDDQERSLKLLRHRGKRSSFEARGGWTQFGPRIVQDSENPQPNIQPGDATQEYTDQFWNADLRYTYRMLGFLYAIDFGAGFMRSERAKVERDGQSFPVGVDLNEPEPGINYGWGGLTLELLDALSFDLKLVLGADEEGFVAGTGILMRIGQIEGTRLEIGTDIIGDIGSTAFFRFAWNTVPYVPMSLTAESTSWPDSDTNPTGTRLIYEASVDLSPTWRVGGRIGTATRFEALRAGWTTGVHTAYSF